MDDVTKKKMQKAQNFLYDRTKELLDEADALVKESRDEIGTAKRHSTAVLKFYPKRDAVLFNKEKMLEARYSLKILRGKLENALHDINAMTYTLDMVEKDVKEVRG